MHARSTRALRFVLLSGCLVSSAAWAQQSNDPREQSEESRESSMFCYESEKNGHTISFTVKDGEVVSARIDGKEISSQRVQRVENGFNILAGDGSVFAHVSQGSGEQQRGQRSIEEHARLQAHAMAQADAQSRGAQQGQRPRVRVLPMDGTEALRAVERDLARTLENRAAAQIAEAPKAMIGVGLGSVDEALAHHLAIDRAKATLITSVVDELPAATAGIERFDVIVDVNTNGDASPTAVRAALGKVEPGSMITLTVRRGQDTKQIEVAAVAFDPTKLATIESQSFDFGLRDAAGFELPDGWMASGIFEDDAEEASDGESDENRMFFIGPDGERRELRMPRMPQIPRMPQAPQAPRAPRDGEQPRWTEQPQSDERIDRLEQQLERLMRELEKLNAQRAPSPTR